MSGRFIVEGANKKNGLEQKLEIEAKDAKEAEQIASSRGLFVSSIRVAGKPPGRLAGKSITLPLPVVIVVGGVIAVFMVGIFGWMIHLSTRTTAPTPMPVADVQPIPVPPIRPTPAPYPVIPSTPASVIRAAPVGLPIAQPVATPQPVENPTTIEDVQACGEHLAMLMKNWYDEVARNSDDRDSAKKNSAKVVRTDLKKSDSLVHPIVGEIVIRTDSSTENKAINYIYYDTETFTVTVYREQTGWKCLKASRKYDSIDGFPKPEISAEHAPGVEHDATTMIQKLMGNQRP